MTRHFLEVDDLSPAELSEVLELAAETEPAKVLDGRAVALLFEKPSLRTRNATEVAVFEHAKLEDLAASASVPVVNLLSDDSHPCQALADLLTLRQQFGRLDGLEIAYVGDYNNVSRSLAIAAAMTGVGVRLACPPGYGPDDADLDRLKLAGLDPLVTTRPAEAVAGADAVYTDVWTSMGQEQESAKRRQAFEGFMVDGDLMAGAAERAVFLHCLPAHRGEEVAGEVVDGRQSVVWQQAENRLHAVRGLFLWLFS